LLPNQLDLKNSWTRSNCLIILPVLFLAVAPAAHPQSTASVAQADLNYLVENAKTIVRGNVVSAVLEPHPQFGNLQTVVVTIAVAKTFKGQASPTLAFRQYVWNVKDVTGPAGYHKSEELLLFLNPTSLYGLTSSVGMEQGHFRILHDKQGNRFAINGRGNVGLFTGVTAKSAARGVTFSPRAMAILSKTGGQISLATLEETIQALLATQP
jgi:hypothetical protein